MIGFLKLIYLIIKAIKILKNKGAKRIILIPIPTKISIIQPPLYPYNDYELVRKSNYPNKSKQSIYNIFHKNLSKYNNLEFVNLYNIFIQNNTIQEPLYILEDSHWTSKGCALGAKAVLKQIDPDFQTNLYKTNSLEINKSYQGDLQNYSNVPNWQFLRIAPLDYAYYDLKKEKINYSKENFIFLGSSYSRSFNDEFIKLIDDNIEKNTSLNLALAGKGSIASLNTLLSNEEYSKQIQNSIIIWEFPFREIIAPSNFKMNTQKNKK